jgi:DNA mismatch repair protein MutL
MEVKDLFYNTPVRLKFLKKSQTEYSNIIEVMQGIAISNPSVAINLIHKGNSSLKTTGSGDFGIAISEVYSKDLIRELAKVSKEDKTEGIKIQGYTSNPDFTRSNKKAIYTFVNGRNVKCPVLIKAVDTAFKDFIPSGRYPFVVLNLVIQGEQVDVNVHPSKRELRYTNPNLVFNFTYSSIRSALENTPSQAKIYPVRPVFKETNSFEPAVFSGQNSKYEAKTHALAPDSVNFSEMREQIEKSIDFYKPEQKRITDLEFEEKNAEKPKIIGQYLNTYILLETSEGLTIIDQHIAHERTLYDRLKSSKEVASQLLLTSDVIELEPSDVSLLLESRETLEKYGYCIEPVSEREIIFKQVPQMLAGKHPEKIINELIEAVKSSIDSIEDNILASTACHASVKAGEKLSIWQMEELVINWQKTIFPKTCPHGRKICHLIPIKELAGFFGRFED